MGSNFVLHIKIMAPLIHCYVCILVGAAPNLQKLQKVKFYALERKCIFILIFKMVATLLHVHALIARCLPCCNLIPNSKRQHNKMLKYHIEKVKPDVIRPFLVSN